MIKKITLLIIATFISVFSQELPSSFDLRDYNGNNYVTSVKNQSGGTCWTHGTMASIESNLLVTGNWAAAGEEGEPNLAEYHLDYWNGFNNHNNDDVSPPSGSGLDLHNGGDYLVAAAYLTRGEGAVRDIDGQSYHAAPDRFNDDFHVYYVRDIEWIPSPADYSNLNRIKRHLIQNGIVATCMAYDNGFMNGYIHYQPPTSSMLPNHSIAIVGWDDNKSTQAPQPGAWLCKNSWDSSWGEQGYFWISYWDKYAGTEEFMGACQFLNVEPMKYSTVYYHDYHGWRDTKENCNEAFNHFVATSSEMLKSVSFYTAKDDVDYTIRIYDSFNGSQLDSLLVEITDAIDIKGFHTIDLDSGIQLTQGDDFYVYLKLSEGGMPYDRTSDVPVLLGGESKTIVESSSRPNESYYMENGSWNDLYEFSHPEYGSHNANFCMKALTVKNAASFSFNEIKSRIERPVNIPVYASGLINIVKMDICFSYNPENMQYLSNSINVSNSNIEVDSLEGTIKISADQFEGESFNWYNGAIADIEFYFKDGSSQLDFDTDKCVLINTSGDTLDISLKNGYVLKDSSESATGLIHNAGNLTGEIFNEGSIGYLNSNGEGNGINWKGTSGIYRASPVFGTTAKGYCNGRFGTYSELSEDLVTDLTNLKSDYELGFMSDTYFNECTRALLDDSGAPEPYNVKILQESYSNSDEEFIILRYGYINCNNESLEDFYAGMFIDFDINAYIVNKADYLLEKNLLYVSNHTEGIIFGVTAISGTAGAMINHTEIDDYSNGDELREASFTNISTMPQNDVKQYRNQKTWLGSKIGTIASGDTAWVTFAVMAGNDLDELKANCEAAYTKANSTNWNDVTTNIEDETLSPVEYSLGNNYPNPFNPSTTIEYSIAKADFVKLTVFNVLGEKVTDLVNEAQQAGTHKVTFNASQLPSGIYFYQISTGDFTQIQKMILLK